MGIVHEHPRRAEGQQAIVDRLLHALVALRDQGVETLARASAALRSLPGAALTGEANQMAAQIEDALVELAAVAPAALPTMESMCRLERDLEAVKARLVDARAAGGACPRS